MLTLRPVNRCTFAPVFSNLRLSVVYEAHVLQKDHHHPSLYVLFYKIKIP